MSKNLIRPVINNEKLIEIACDVSNHFANKMVADYSSIDLRRFLVENNAQSSTELAEKLRLEAICETIDACWIAINFKQSKEKAFDISSFHYQDSRYPNVVDFAYKFLFSPEFIQVGFADPMGKILYSNKIINKRVIRMDRKRFSSDEEDGTISIFSKSTMLPNVFLRQDIENDIGKIKNYISSNYKDENFATVSSWVAKELLSLTTKIQEIPNVIDEAQKCVSEVYNHLEFPALNKTELDEVAKLIIDAYVWNCLNHSDWNHIYYIAENVVDGIPYSSGVCIGAKKILTPNEINILCFLTDRIFGAFYYISHSWNLRLSNTKSAIGSIMSRNGSHNIGSHVLAALTHNVGTMPDDRIFYQYLQQRMDYIATVTTDFPSWGNSTMFVGDMMKTFFSQRHLLEYISGSEGLHAYFFQDPNLGDMERRKQTSKIKLFIRRIHENIRSAEENEGVEIGSRVEWKLLEESVNDHALHFIRYPDKENIHFIDYQNVSFLPLEHDVSLAIPGGVIGEHAFFTILENIIRNAAKHGWATHSRESNNIGNLEIYIDFLDAPSNDYIDFTVWDNMSDVLKTYKAADKETRTRIACLSNNADVLLPLDNINNKVGFEMLKNACDAKAAENDKIDIKNLPLHWQQQLLLNQPLITEQGDLRRENWGLAEMRISAGYLQRCTIGEIGRLEELRSKEGKEDHIILPVAVPGVCTHPDNKNGGIRCNSCNHLGLSDCPIQKDLYHLGYRFKIPQPKEMLIVLNSEINFTINVVAFKKKGVYFAKEQGGQYYLTKDDGNIDEKPITIFNFDYVIFPNEKIAESYGASLLSKDSNELLSANDGQKLTEEQKMALCKSMFPFRLLAIDDAFKRVFAKVQEAAAKTDETKIQAVKNEVYRLWLESLKRDWGLEKEPLLSMQLQTEGNSESGTGLITNRDLLEFVFFNNFQSVITNLMTSTDLSDAPESSRGILELLACYPSPVDEIPAVIGEDICDTIAQVLRQCCENLRNNYLELKKGYDEEGKFVHDFITSYQARINADDNAKAVLDRVNPEEIKIQMGVFTGAIDDTPDDDFNALDIIFGNRTSKSSEKSPFSTLVDPAPPVLLRLAKSLFAAYQTADTLLRKYEKHIVTLPWGYSADAYSGEKNISSELNEQLQQNVGIELVNGGSPLIKYCRHDNWRRKETIYAEALSGSQSYLNTLSRITHKGKQDHTGTFVRLAENALLRLLIVDERVSDFLKAHPTNVRTFEAMNIDVAKLTENVPDVVKADTKCITLADLSLFTQSQYGKKWDILIIHQGIIDKWFPNDHQDKNAVGELIRNLQTQINFARVVVTTGRGRPDNIPDWVKILPFSMLERTLFRNYPEKLLLVGAVMNALPNQPSK